MKKLTTGMRNLELIKWCTYYGINNLYNILVGFPGETAADFTSQAELVGKIAHLQPPYAIAKARADRGSPMYTDPDAQGVHHLRPASCYQFIFPDGLFDLQHISYYFEHECEDLAPAAERRELFARVEAWRARWQRKPRPSLTYRKGLNSIVIEDGRGSEIHTSRYFHEQAALYEFCADARTITEIRKWTDNVRSIEQALADFVERGFMVYLDDRYLSLALPENRYFDSASFIDHKLDRQESPPDVRELITVT
jgi:hypothetical protein